MTTNTIVSSSYSMHTYYTPVAAPTAWANGFYASSPALATVATTTACTATSPTDWDSVRQTLVEARGYLSDPEHWCKAVAAAGARRCLGEAITRASMHGLNWPQVRLDALKLVASQVPDVQAHLAGPLVRIQCFNDAFSTTHTDVLDVLDHAIKIAAEEAGLS